MAKQQINLGTPDKGNGDPIRTAFAKVNSNFDELYARTGDDIQIPALAGNSGKVLTTNGTTLSWSVSNTFNQSLNTTNSVTFNSVAASMVNVSQINGTNPGNELVIQANNHNWTFGTDGNLTLPAGGDIVDSNGQSVLGGAGGGLSITDFGRGFTNTLDSGKITTSKLYNRPANQALNNHFELSVTNGGVVALPDGSIINGATLKTIAGNYAGITAGPASPAGKDEDSWVWVDNDGATIATKYSTDNHTWTFNNNGGLTFPQGTFLGYSDPGGFIIDGAVDKDIAIYTYSGADAHGWTFGTDGVLTLPPDGTISNTVDGIKLETNRGTLAIGTNMEAPGVAQHFHIAFDSSNSSPSANDLFLGDDYNYVKLPGYELNITNPYGVEIGTHYRGGPQNVAVTEVDELVPPGGVWRLFISDSEYPNLGATVSVGDPVDIAWGSQISATITEINQVDGDWQIQVDQDITAGFNAGPKTVSFGSQGNGYVWRFETDGKLTLPTNGTISYAPYDTDNWNAPTVNTISAALDELAARVTALQNFEIDGGNAYTPAVGELLIDGNGA